MDQREEIKEGMIVRSVDGHKLGRVYAVGGTEFHIEKGLFFPKDYSVRYSEVSTIRDGEIILAHGRDSLKKFSLDDVPNADPLDSGRAPIARADSPGITSWRDLDRPATPSELSGLRSDDLGYQEISPHNTEGASASPLLTEEDRARGRMNSRSLEPTLREPGFLPPSPEVRPTLRASSLDETVGVVSPGAQDFSRSSSYEEDYRAALIENDYRAAIVEDEHFEESRRSNTRGDADLEGQRRLNFSGEDDLLRKGRY